MTPKACSVLIVGLGNPDRADDGIGPLVVDELRRLLPADVMTASPRVDPIALIAEWEGFDAAICVDAACVVGEPGRIHRFDLSMVDLPPELQPVSNHALGLAAGIRLARVLRQAPRDIIVYAVEGVSFVAGAPMTPEVAMQAPKVAAQIAAEVERLRVRDRDMRPRLSRSAGCANGNCPRDAKANPTITGFTTTSALRNMSPAKDRAVQQDSRSAQQ